MNELDMLAGLVRKHSSGAPANFRPCAFYDEQLDCIRVISRDCSVIEDRLNSRITVLVDAHHSQRHMPESLEYVGFTIKGAWHFCQERGLAPGTIKMTTLLDALLKAYPEVIVRLFVEHVARPIVEQKKIDQVDVRGAAIEPA